MAQFLAEIRLFGGGFAPRGWMYCQGQLLPISSYTALFSILGTTYGGDGRTTFGLPDLRGRLPMHQGTHPGSNYTWQRGQSGGTELTTLTVNNLPSHFHTGHGTVLAKAAPGTERIPTGHSFAGATSDFQYSTLAPDVTMKDKNVSVTTDYTGGGQSFNNIQPFQIVSYIISIEGIYPSRS